MKRTILPILILTFILNARFALADELITLKELTSDGVTIAVKADPRGEKSNIKNAVLYIVVSNVSGGNIAYGGTSNHPGFALSLIDSEQKSIPLTEFGETLNSSPGKELKTGVLKPGQKEEIKLEVGKSFKLPESNELLKCKLRIWWSRLRYQNETQREPMILDVDL